MLVKALGKNVCKLILRRDKLDTMGACQKTFSDEVVVQLDVFSAGVKDWVGGHVCGAEIVTVEGNG